MIPVCAASVRPSSTAPSATDVAVVATRLKIPLPTSSSSVLLSLSNTLPGTMRSRTDDAIAQGTAFKVLSKSP